MVVGGISRIPTRGSHDRDQIIHIFLDISRDLDDLDSLWSEAPQVEIPQEYYFAPEDEAESGSKSNQYF